MGLIPKAGVRLSYLGSKTLVVAPMVWVGHGVCPADSDLALVGGGSERRTWPCSHCQNCGRHADVGRLS